MAEIKITKVEPTFTLELSLDELQLFHAYLACSTDEGRTVFPLYGVLDAALHEAGYGEKYMIVNNKDNNNAYLRADTL